jgi:hypothetical protein
MRRLVGLLIIVVLCGTTLAAQGSTERTQLAKATDVVNEIMQAPDKGIPKVEPVGSPLLADPPAPVVEMDACVGHREAGDRSAGIDSVPRDASAS